MFNANLIVPEYMGLVGLEQNYDGNGIQISSSLTASSSGLVVNQNHPLITIDNLLSCAPEYSRLGLDQTEQETKFNEWLTTIIGQSIIKTLNLWISQKQIDRSGRNLLGRNELFTNSGGYHNLDNNTGDLVGIEVRPLNSMSVVYEIHRIGLQLSAEQTLRVYLFHSDKITPIESQDITIAAGDVNGWKWHTLETAWRISGRGTWFIGYLQDDLIGQSINGVYDYNYHDSGRLVFPTGTEYIASAFKAGTDTAELWNISTTGYTASTNYGLNLSITAKCDYTDLLIEQKGLFAYAISKQIAIDLLRKIRSNANARTNSNETNINQDETLFDIHGNPQGRHTGLEKELHDALAGIMFDDRIIDKICLPCQSKGARWIG